MLRRKYRKTITHELKFIDSFRFMMTSLSILVNNLIIYLKFTAKSVEGVKKKKLNQCVIL